MAAEKHLQGIIAASADRVRACSDAALALRAGLNALEDARQKVRQRLTQLADDEAGNREGLRDALAIIGHLITVTQTQVPISEGQLMEARYTYGSLSALDKPDTAPVSVVKEAPRAVNL